MNSNNVTSGRTAQRPRHRGLTLAAVLPAVLAACDVSLMGPVGDPGNVGVVYGVVLEHRDTAVVVNGNVVIRHASADSALQLERFERYDFGGFAEIGMEQATRYTETYRMMFTHARPRTQRGDTVVLSYYDHGRLLVGGSELPRLGAPAPPLSGPPVTLESFVRYLGVGQARAEWQTGGSMIESAPWFPAAIAGQPVAVTTTGSMDTQPLNAAVTLRPFVRLVGLSGGGALDLDSGTPPVVSAQTALTIEFDRPFDPSRTLVMLLPLGRTGNAGRGALVRPVASTQRLVVPSDVLQQLKSGGTAQREPFRLLILEVLTEPGVVRGRFAGGSEFALPFVQRGETTVNFYLER